MYLKGVPCQDDDPNGAQLDHGLRVKQAPGKLWAQHSKCSCSTERDLKQYEVAAEYLHQTLGALTLLSK